MSNRDIIVTRTSRVVAMDDADLHDELGKDIATIRLDMTALRQLGARFSIEPKKESQPQDLP